jgi:hypothetical protein
VIVPSSDNTKYNTGVVVSFDIPVTSTPANRVTVDNEVLLKMNIQLKSFTGDSNSLVYKRVAPFPNSVVPVDNLIVPGTFELIPRINDDVIKQVVYLEGNMADAWNSTQTSDALKIPSDMTKYVEFLDDNSFAPCLVTMDPAHENYWISNFIDTYILCRRNANNEFNCALPLSTNAWTTYFMQHLGPDMFLQDEFYIYPSFASPTSFSS